MNLPNNSKATSKKQLHPAAAVAVVLLGVLLVAGLELRTLEAKENADRDALTVKPEQCLNCHSKPELAYLNAKKNGDEDLIKKFGKVAIDYEKNKKQRIKYPGTMPKDGNHSSVGY